MWLSWDEDLCPLISRHACSDIPEGLVLDKDRLLVGLFHGNCLLLAAVRGDEDSGYIPQGLVPYQDGFLVGVFHSFSPPIVSAKRLAFPPARYGTT